MPGLLDPEDWGAQFGSDAPVTAGLLAQAPAAGLLAPPQAELRSYQPTPREWLHNQFTRYFGGGPDGASAADQVMALIGVTPLAAPLSAYDAGRTLGGGLYRSDLGDIAQGALGIGLGGLQAALPLLFGRASTLTKAAEIPENDASRHLFIYNPPDLPQRPFTADYPSGASADEQGSLTRDIERRPLGAQWVVGRKMVGGDDQPLPVEQYDALAEAGTGKLPQTVAPGKIGGAFGAVALQKGTGFPTDLYLSNRMAPDQTTKVLGHELSHVVDHLADQIDTSGLSAELKQNYNTLNNPNRLGSDPAQPANWGKPATPQTYGYKGDEVPREQMAEAIRAYMTNPNYLKTVAPNTAARIRAAVNANPYLSKIIQFNGIAAAPALGGIPQQQDNSGQ